MIIITILSITLFASSCSTSSQKEPADHVNDGSVDTNGHIGRIEARPDLDELKDTAHLPSTDPGTSVRIPEPAPTTEAPASAFDHTLWGSLLQAHVSNDGLVDYAAFAKDARFATYLSRLSAAEIDASWSVNERKAFWINVYNAFTIRLILDHPGVKSIKDISSPWKTEFFSINGQKMDLDHVEHTELRKNLDDPRIHFGIVCASFSCPQLWNQAYTAGGLDKQLDDAARRFINDPLRNELGKDHVRLSRIFDWFKGDFTKKSSLIAYINKYAAEPVAPNAEVEFLEYDWKLNGK